MHSTSTLIQDVRLSRRAISFLPLGLVLFFLVHASPGCLAQQSTAGKEPIEPVVVPFAMPPMQRPNIPDRVINIRQCGATEGGIVKCTAAIQRAIDSTAGIGGGTVLVPEGKFLTGAIHLKDSINLHLAKGAELLFSQDPSDYLPVVFSRHEDIECYKYSAFIYANGRTNIAVTGEGVLNGQGKPWWEWKKSKKEVEARLYEMGARGVPLKDRLFDGTGGNALRPAFFQPMNCSNVLVEGVTFLYGAFWTITPTYCENVIVRRVKIVTEGDYGHTPNGDGVDPSSCRNVLIEHCIFDTGDDCIAIKAGRDNDGIRVGRPTENVVVRHCLGLRGHGGIVIGSETSGGVRNVFGEDCAFRGTDRIVRIKTARGRGGILENMWFRHLSADTIEQEAVHLNMLYTGTRYPETPVTRATPRMRNIHISDIRCAYAKRYAVEMLGLPEMPIDDVTVDHVVMTAARGIACTDVRNVRLSSIDVRPTQWPLISLTDGAGVTLDSLAVPDGANPLLRVSGPKSAEIRLLHTRTAPAAAVLSVEGGATAGAVAIGQQ